MLIRRRMGYFCSDRTVWEAKLHSTDLDGVPTPPFKRGVVSTGGVLSREDISGDVTDSDRRSRETRLSK
jgi:hypothetical protein